MEEKRKDLKSTHQKEVIQEIVEELNKSNPEFYYRSTSEVAAEIKKYIHESHRLNHIQHELLKDLSRRDIQILLSLHGE